MKFSKMKRANVGGFNIISMLIGLVVGVLFGEKIKEKVPFLSKLGIK